MAFWQGLAAMFVPGKALQAVGAQRRVAGLKNKVISTLQGAIPRRGDGHVIHMVGPLCCSLPAHLLDASCQHMAIAWFTFVPSWPRRCGTVISGLQAA